MAAVAASSSGSRPDVIHAHDPHGVAVAALALLDGGRLERRAGLVASRRVDFHLKTNSLSRWKYRQVDCFVAASEAIRSMLLEGRRAGEPGGDGARRHRPRTRRRRPRR